jgi:hypothetical protein
VGVTAGVGVGTGVAVGATVAVGVEAMVGVGVGATVGVGVAVGATVGAAVGTGVSVGIGVSVGAAVGTGVSVGIEVTAGATVVITSWGGFTPSRDESDRAVLFVVDRPKLIRPLPVTAEVTSTLVQAFAVTLPELPSCPPNGGALESVIVVSPHVLSATENTE